MRPIIEPVQLDGFDGGCLAEHEKEKRLTGEALGARCGERTDGAVMLNPDEGGGEAP
jgi:hypothetical protein